MDVELDGAVGRDSCERRASVIGLKGGAHFGEVKRRKISLPFRATTRYARI